MAISKKTTKFSNLTALRELSILKQVLSDGVISGVAPYSGSNWDIGLSSGTFIVDSTVMENDVNESSAWDITAHTTNAFDKHFILYVEYRYDDENVNTPELYYLHGSYSDNISLEGSRGDAAHDPISRGPQPYPSAVKLADVFVPASATDMSSPGVIISRVEPLHTKKQICEKLNTNIQLFYGSIKATLLSEKLTIDFEDNAGFMGISEKGELTSKGLNLSEDIPVSAINIPFSDLTSGFILFARSTSDVEIDFSTSSIEYALIENQSFIINGANQEKIHGDQNDWTDIESYGYRPDLGNIYIIAYGKSIKSEVSLKLVDGSTITLNLTGQTEARSINGRVTNYVHSIESSVHSSKVYPDINGNIDLADVITNLQALANITLDVAYDSTTPGAEPGSGNLITVDAAPVELLNNWYHQTPLEHDTLVDYTVTAPGLGTLANAGSGTSIESIVSVDSLVTLIAPSDIDFYPYGRVLRFKVTALNVGSIDVSFVGWSSDQHRPSDMDLASHSGISGASLMYGAENEYQHTKTNPWNTSIEISSGDYQFNDVDGFQKTIGTGIGVRGEDQNYNLYESEYHTPYSSSEYIPDGKSTSATNAIIFKDWLYLSYGNDSKVIKKDQLVQISRDTGSNSEELIRISDESQTPNNITDSELYDIFRSAITHGNFDTNTQNFESTDPNSEKIYVTLRPHPADATERDAFNCVYYLYYHEGEAVLMPTTNKKTTLLIQQFFPTGNDPFNALCTMWRETAIVSENSRLQNLTIAKSLHASSIFAGRDHGQNSGSVQIINDVDSDGVVAEFVSSVDNGENIENYAFPSSINISARSTNATSRFFNHNYISTPSRIRSANDRTKLSINLGNIQSRIVEHDNAIFSTDHDLSSANHTEDPADPGYATQFVDRFSTSTIISATKLSDKSVNVSFINPTQLEVVSKYRQVLIGYLEYPLSSSQVGKSIDSGYTDSDERTLSYFRSEDQIITNLDLGLNFVNQVNLGGFSYLTFDGDHPYLFNIGTQVYPQTAGNSTIYTVSDVNLITNTIGVQPDSFPLGSLGSGKPLIILAKKTVDLGRSWMPTLGVYDSKVHPDRSNSVDPDDSFWKYGTTIEIGNLDPGSDSISNEDQIFQPGTLYGPIHGARSTTLRFMSREETFTDYTSKPIEGDVFAFDNIYGFNYDKAYTSAQITVSHDRNYASDLHTSVGHVDRHRYFASKIDFHTSASWMKVSGKFSDFDDPERAFEADYDRPLTGLGVRARIDSQGFKAKYIVVNELGDDWSDSKAPASLYVENIRDLNSHYIDNFEDYKNEQPSYTRNGLELKTDLINNASQRTIKNINNDSPFLTHKIGLTILEPWVGNGGGTEGPSNVADSKFIYADGGVIFRDNPTETSESSIDDVNFLVENQSDPTNPSVYINQINTKNPSGFSGLESGSIFSQQSRPWSHQYLRVHRGLDTDNIHANVGAGSLFVYDHIAVRIDRDTAYDGIIQSNIDGAVPNTVQWRHPRAYTEDHVPVKYTIIGSAFGRVKIVRGGTHRGDGNIKFDGANNVLKPYPTNHASSQTNLGYTHDTDLYNHVEKNGDDPGQTYNSNFQARFWNGPGDGVVVFECKHNDVFAPITKNNTWWSMTGHQPLVGNVSVSVSPTWVKPSTASNYADDPIADSSFGFQPESIGQPGDSYWLTGESLLDQDNQIYQMNWWLQTNVRLGDNNPIIRPYSDDAYNNATNPAEGAEGVWCFAKPDFWNYQDGNFVKKLKYNSPKTHTYNTSDVKNNFVHEPYCGWKRNSRRFSIHLSSMDFQLVPNVEYTTYNYPSYQPFIKSSIGSPSGWSSQSTYMGVNTSSSTWTKPNLIGTEFQDVNSQAYFRKHPKERGDGGGNFSHFSTRSAIGTILYITVYSAKNWDYPETQTGYEIEPNRTPMKEKILNNQSIRQPQKPFDELSEEIPGTVTDKDGYLTGESWEDVSDPWYSQEI